MDRDVDEVVAAGERLVDGVVDDLVDEVVKAARTGRADVHPGAEPDGLEAFQDRDVLCGVIRLGHAAQITFLNKKSPANRAFYGCSVSETVVGGGPCEARGGSSGDRGAQLLVGHGGRELLGEKPRRAVGLGRHG